MASSQNEEKKPWVVFLEEKESLHAKNLANLSQPKKRS